MMFCYVYTLYTDQLGILNSHLQNLLFLCDENIPKFSLLAFTTFFHTTACLFSKGLSASFEWVIKAKDIIVLSCIKILKSVPPLNVQSITNQNENTKKKIIKNYSFNKYWIQFQLLFIRVITYLTLVI